ncbi:hypothetical protein Goari_006494, partial [Gossypium aridum]|nr:hypothetical protein [Gossypium aridum]
MVDVFALSIYGLIIFPKVLGHIDEAVSNLFDQFDKRGLQDENVEWRGPWMIPDEILYRCGDFDWVSLHGIWEAIGYAPLLILRVNDNVPVSSQENTWPIEEHLQVILSKLEIKVEAEKMRKGKNKAEEDLDSLKIDYKKLHFSMRTVGL